MRSVLALAALVALASCDSVDLYDAAVGDLIVSLEGDDLRIETEETYPCTNYPLVVKAESPGDHLDVEIVGIGQIDVCQTGVAPAVARAIARVPTPDTSEQEATPSYDVEIEKDGETDRYRLVCGVDGCEFGAAGSLHFSRLGPR